MVTDNAPEPMAPDPSMLRLLARAHDLHDRLAADPELTVAALARREQLSLTYVSRLLRLRWLAPSIVHAILEGRQPAKLNATALMHQPMLPASWGEQQRLLALA